MKEKLSIFFEGSLPYGWTRATIGELLASDGVFIDGDWVETKDQNPLGEVRLIQLADVGEGEYRNRSERNLTMVKAHELGCTFLMPEDILIARMPDPLGRACIFPGDSKPSVTVVDVCVVRMGRSGANNRWLMYMINSPAFRSAVVSLQSGTTRQRISRSNLAILEMPVPPLSEQHRIVAAIEQQFSRLDAAVAALRRAQAKLKRYRAAVLKAAVEGKLTEAWRVEHPITEPASNLLERILAERRAKWEADLREKGKDPAKVRYVDPAKPDVASLPELPEGWCWARAEQLCDFITKGTTPAADKLYSGTGEIPFVKVYNLTNYGVLDFSVNPTFVSKRTHSQELTRSKVIPGDVLMNIVGPPLGKVSIVPDLFSEWNINQAIVFFRPMPSYDRDFLCFSLLTDQILSWAKLRAKATAGQFNLTLEICRDLPLPLPPLAEQEQIVAEVDRRLSVVSQLEATVAANLKRAERLRQSILKEAFAGRLVPQDPSDEPANILLERIRKERDERKNGAVNKGRVVSVAEPVKIDVSETKQVELWEGVGG